MRSTGTTAAPSTDADAMLEDRSLSLNDWVFAAKAPSVSRVAGWLYVASGLLVVQAALWIVLPLLFEGSVRLDVAEGAIDGPEWRLSYLRHPPFSSWLTGLASMAGPYRYAAVYATGVALACAAFAIGAAFIARVDRPAAGLIALMAGLASPFAAYVPIQVNHNIGVMPFWAATLCAAWFAFEGGALGAWALLGLAIGLGLWAKYAILHLAAPLGVLFFCVPAWRRQALAVGPWLAALICGATVAPHLIDVAHKGATTLAFAARTTPASAPERLGWAIGFIGNCLLVQMSMALIVLVACGRAGVTAALASMFGRATRSRLDLFLHVAAFGPPLLIVLATPLGVRTHYLWITPLAIGFAVWYGHLAARAGLEKAPPSAWRVYAAIVGVTALAYVSVRELAPGFSRAPAYPEMDGPALAEVAQRFWASHENGPIPYIVSLDGQHGRQAAGSIVFDLPYRVRTLEDGVASNAPWLDIGDLKRRGALVVAMGAIAAGATVQGVEVRETTLLARPMMRGAPAPPIYFGILPPGS